MLDFELAVMLFIIGNKKESKKPSPGSEPEIKHRNLSS